MTVQARAEATRKTIILAAVELFDTVGYGSTTMGHIIDRAGITKGAFYYHFPTKESVAAAIIEDADTVIEVSTASAFGSPSAPMLECLIRTSFISADVTRNNALVRVGNLLRQALNQISPSGAAPYLVWRKVVIAMVRGAAAEGDVQDGIDVEALGHAIWSSLVGTALLSGATGEDPIPRLAQVWEITLRGVVPAESLPYFNAFVTRTAQQYRRSQPISTA